MKKDKFGIKICPKNCINGYYHCDHMLPCNPNCEAEFEPSTNALKGRIIKLQKQVEAFEAQFYTALIRQFQWAEYDTYAEANCGAFLFKVEKMDKFDSWQWSVYITPTKYVYDDCGGLKDGEQAAQEWLATQFLDLCKFPLASSERVLVLSLDELDLLKRGINEIFGDSPKCLDNFKTEKKAKITRILAKINDAILEEESEC